ncbi:hypothetical protein [Prosthecobacter sp.]|uniref:hypothetical protein n=1 Tax=Prosthecobacter sp. TaxID=1965333 RepID=UPI003784A5E5
MIIFSGLGLLIPVFYFLGVIPVMVLCTFMKMDFMKSFALSSWAGAAMVLLFSKTIGRSKKQRLLDPQTGRQVLLASRHTIFFMNGMVCTVLAVLFSLFLSVQAMRGKKSFVLLDGTSKSTAGAAPFIAADKQFLKAGASDAGNTSEAQKLAQGLSTALKGISIQSSDANGSSTPLGGTFVTYCQLSREGCVFLVVTPGFAKRSPEETAVLKDTGWSMAQMQVAELNPKPRQLAVAFRGVNRYESIWIGVPAALDPDVTEPGVKTKFSGSGENALYQFFEPGRDEPSSPTIAAGRPEKGGENPAPETSTSPNAPAPASPPPVPAPLTDTRDWKSADGRPLRAALLRVTNDAGGSGVFRRADGQEFTIPFEKFDKEDLKLLQSFSSGRK